MKRVVVVFAFLVFILTLHSTPCFADEKKFEKTYRYVIDAMKANVTLIESELQKRGYVKATGSRRAQNAIYDFRWTWDFAMAQATSPLKQVNHFPSFAEVGRKDRLLTNLRQHYTGESSIVQDCSAYDDLYKFFPRSYFMEAEEQLFKADFLQVEERIANKNEGNSLVIEDANEVIAVLEDDENATRSHCIYPFQEGVDGQENLWILKPGGQARGVGISVHRELDSVLETCKNKKNEVMKPFIVQRYIERPFLGVKKLKFDIRQFVLVTSLDPKVIFLFNDFYLRFTSKPFSLLENLTDPFIHLTNHQVQKDSPTYQTSPIAENQWSSSQFKQFLREEYDRDVWEADIYPALKNLVVNSILAWPSEGHRPNSFELLGFDIMLDEDLRPWLLEINTNPGLHMLTDVVRPHHTSALQDLFKVVLDQPREFREASASEWAEYVTKNAGLDESMDSGKWEIVFRGEREEIP